MMSLEYEKKDYAYSKTRETTFSRRDTDGGEM